MSFKPIPHIVKFDSLSASTLTITGSTVQIQGLPAFDVADVVECEKTCPTACVPQVVLITPVVPSAPCACPWFFEMTVVRKSKGFRRVSGTHERTYLYEYTNPSGDPPTAALIATSLTAQINSDPNAPFTATDGGGTITLTEKDCDSMDGTRGFNVYVNSGTVSVSTPHTSPILPAYEVQQYFPVLPGSQFGNPNTAFCGTYCRYYLRIKPISTSRDPHLFFGWVEREMEVEIWVNNEVANFAADWDAELTGALTCL